MSLLAERQISIAEHALAAWDSNDLVEWGFNLRIVQTVPHQIAGSAGSLGFHAIGDAARKFGGSIIDYLEGAVNEGRVLPVAILAELDNFIAMSQALLSDTEERT